jgi:hypothetical protein
MAFPPGDSGDEYTFTIGDPDGTGDDEPKPEEKNRQEKKEERPGLMEALETTRGELAQAREEIAELRGRVSAGGGGPKPVGEEELDAIASEEQALIERYNARASDEKNPITPQEATQFQKDMRGIERKKYTTYARIDREAAQPSAADTAAQTLQAQLTNEFPEVFSDKRIRAWAYGEMMRRAAKGESQTLDVGREVCGDALVEFGKRAPARKADDSERDATAGTGGGSTGGGSRGGGRTWTPNKAEREMAMSFTKDLRAPDGGILSERQRLQWFANNILDADD